MEFLGYKRDNGAVGVRNHVVVMPGVVCAGVAARKIVQAVPGTVFLQNSGGCGQSPADTETTLRIMAGLLANPNVFGAVIVGLGCEFLQEAQYAAALSALTAKPLCYVTIQEQGLNEAVRKGTEHARELLAQASAVRRTPCDVGSLLLGLECGGSDPTSGLSANVVLGMVSNRLIDLGGSAVLTETPEAIGAEHILRRRGRTPAVGQAIYDAVRGFEKKFADAGINVRDGNPSPGNIEGGITTLEEKSLGCIHKSGTKPFEAFYRYGEQVTAKGLSFLDATAFDVASVTAKAAAGSQITVFTTGRGNPVGNPICPVIKMTANPDTARRLWDIIDFDCSGTVTGEKTLAQSSDELWACLLRVCEGELTAAERNGAEEILIDHQMCYV